MNSRMEGMVAIDGMNNGRGIKATVMITKANEDDVRYTYQPGYNVVLSCGVAPKDAERYFALLDMVIDKDALRESGVIPMFEEKAPASIEINFDPQTETPFTVNYFKLDNQYDDYVEGILNTTQSEVQLDGKLMLQYGDEFTLVDLTMKIKAILVLQRLLVSGVALISV